MNRRELFRSIGAASGVAGIVSLLNGKRAIAAEEKPSLRGLPPLKITDIKAITTAPSGIRLTVVKVETNEPGLYGLGCATFNQRTLPVKIAVDEYLKPFAVGRSADDIEDLWQNAFTSSYWRNGPVLNNALSGLDQALWDIKGKRAGMPVYQLLGGRCRFAVDTYAHCGGRDVIELQDDVQKKMAEGYRHVRIQLGGYGAAHLSQQPDFRNAGFGESQDGHMDVFPYVSSTPKMFEHIRKTCGEEIELLHDIHERIPPIDAINLIKSLEQYRPYFIEDPFAPEAIGWFKMLREQSSVPIAMGELFNNPHEWIDLIVNRHIDYIRVHLSQIGGLTPGRKLATLAETFQVLTAWHGPGDVSPVGHAANAHLDLAVHNFGIQERVIFDEATQEVFPGCPTMKNGYMMVNDAAGWGVDIDEKAAAKYPLPDHPGYWNPIRRRDGTAVRP